jgi:hypothetical protein
MSDIVDQPMPAPNESRPIVDLVIEDLLERRRIGTERYGTPLQAFNGRNALVDFYQELLDGVQYVRQVIEERPQFPVTSEIMTEALHRLRHPGRAFDRFDTCASDAAKLVAILERMSVL